MTLSDIAYLRLQNQQIEDSKFSSPEELVGWMGAMQAQDFPMAKWAIGLRITQSSENFVENAYNQGNIIRTHLLRPTWHLVTSEDIHWIQQLTARHIKPVFKSNNKILELSEQIYYKSNQLLESVLSNGINMTREELVSEYENIHIRTDENRLSHLLMNAELDGIICSGPLKNGKITYSLLDERVPTKKTLNRDESLAELAKRYFKSHSPSSIKDFLWWSGLPVSDAKKALEMVKSGFNYEVIDSETYWFTDLLCKNEFKHSVHLLPAFDEFLIAYRNRNATITLTDNKKAVSDNGIFRPIIVIDGQVTGIWKRTMKKDTVQIGINLFQPQNEQIKLEIENKAVEYAKFLNKKLELKFDN